MNLLNKLFGPAQPVPKQYRSNFLHLYLDIAWFGVLNASTLSFLAVYATHLGASTQQIGLINASPAIINLILTMPSGFYIARFSVYKATAISAALTRFFYLLLVPLPWLFPANVQVWVIILLVLLMNVPGTFNAVIGTAFMAEAIPPEWRGHVVGVRNALLAAVSVLTSIVVGAILQRMSFAAGYQVIFFLGFLGAAMSNLHLFLVRPVKAYGKEGAETAPLPEVKPIAAKKPGIRLDVWKGKFGRLLLLMFYYELAILIAGPLFPIYQVRVLKVSDSTISLGVSIFWLVNFIGSLQTSRLCGRLGHKNLFAIGTAMVGVTVLIFAFSYQVPVYLFTQVISGMGWALIGVGATNYLLENVPDDDRPAYLSWYNLLINGAILIGSLVGPLLAGQMGLLEAMVLVGGLRLLAGLLIWKWG